MRENSGEASLLVIVALGIVVLLAGIVIIRTILSAGEGGAAEHLCRASIATQAKLHHASAGEFSAALECEPHTLEVDPADAAAKGTIAAAMGSCWERWGRGKLELFDAGLYCSPCAFLSFSDESAVEMSTYLAETPVQEGGQTYTSYLTRRPSTGRIPERPSAGSLATGKEQVILFLQAHDAASVAFLETSLPQQELIGHVSTYRTADGTGAAGVLLLPNNADALALLGCQQVAQDSHTGQREV